MTEERMRRARRPFMPVATAALVVALLGLTGAIGADGARTAWAARAAGPPVPTLPTLPPLPTYTPQAPLPTYTPQATATERPTYTPVPTATERPHAGTLTLTPSDVELPGGSNSAAAIGAGKQITVLGSNLPSNANVDLTLEGGPGNGVDLIQADTNAHTDGAGTFSYRAALPENVTAGTYVVDARVGGLLSGFLHNGPVVGHATLRVVAAPGAGAKPGMFCFLPGDNACIDLGNLMGSLLMGSLSWWNGFQAAGQKELAGGIVPAILQQPDLTGHQYSALGAFLGYFIQFGKAALTLLITIRVIAYVVDLFQARPARALLILCGELVLVYWYATILSGVEHSVWTWVESAVQYIGKDALKPLTKALAALTTIDKADLASLTTFVLGVLVSLVLLVVMVVMLGIILLTRIGTFVLLVALFIIAPLCIPCVLLSATRPIALWWLKSIVALTALPLVYVIEISAGVAFVLALTGSGGVFDNPLVRVAAGVALIGVLLTAPELTTEAVSRVGAGGGRALTIARNPALAAATKARNKVRSIAPRWL